ncbi:hypothetical protein [Serratia marcescens]|uniref:hypothetical protein n=1 Tax=Serratia marcescens TaxID=615 RepID=UPI0013D96F6F|nr:hypothetical protein [Serratia marcescens]
MPDFSMRLSQSPDKLLTIPFNAATDFTVLAIHCENFAETLIERVDTIRCRAPH